MTSTVLHVFAMAFLLTGCAGPQPPDVLPYADIDPRTGVGDLSAYLLAYAHAYDVPALAGAIVTSDGLIAIGSAGVRVRGGTDSVAVDDVWHLGSNTKSMTATLAALLVRDGFISWNARIVDVLGNELNDIDPGWALATLSQLLDHTAGAPPAIHERYPDLWETLRSGTLSPTEQRVETARRVLAIPPGNAPGSVYEYSNSGYMIAGLMLETVTGLSWETMIVDSLFSPIGITSAGFGAPGLDQPTAAEATEPWGHESRGKSVPPGADADNPSGLGPAGTVHMSIRDWARYAQFHLRGDAGLEFLLDSADFAFLHRLPPGAVEPYNMGWQITDEAGPSTRVLKHDGSNTLWFAMIWIPIEKDFAVVVASNQGGDRAREAVDQALWNLALDQFSRK